MRSGARRTASLLALVLVFLILAGATYQGVATAIERRQFPHPGRMVDVGGYQLHLHCTGRRPPTVVLEAPASGMSAAWGWVQPAVAASARVCSYDRAGLGWSEASDDPFNPAAVPDQLHALLTHAGEHAPFVIAGQGLGAAYARLYDERYPDDVKGLVLIDPPDQADGPAPLTPLARFASVSPWLARAGVLRAARMFSRHSIGLPDTSAGAFNAFLNRPDHLARAASELSQWDATIAMAGRVNRRNGPPIASVNVAGPDRVAVLVDERQAALATRAILTMVDRVRQPDRHADPINP